MNASSSLLLVQVGFERTDIASDTNKSRSEKEEYTLIFEEASSKLPAPKVKDRLWQKYDPNSSKYVLLYNVNLTYDTEVIFIRGTTGSTSQSPPGNLIDRVQSSLYGIVGEYIVGEKDIPDLVIQLGKDWAPSSVVMLLENLGISRSLPHITLSQEAQTRVLKRLADIRASKQSSSYSSPSWIKREVIATQRIELVNVTFEDLNG